MANNAVRLIAPVLLGALILLFPAGGLRALGLGEARVDSWLGQPLDVSIRLLDVQSEEIESISVGPASLEDHERLGVPSDSLGLGLEVTVDRRVDPPRVRVRSGQPVNDPVVQILIDARWASGRVLREYTLFLDPPVVESAAPIRRVSESAARPETRPEPVEQAPRESAQPTPQTRPSPAQPAQPAESEPEPTAPRQAAGAVDVNAGDTLWSIASSWRPDQSLSMDQVMLAIFNRNRSAFLGENINRLRSDVRLDMPSLADVRGIDRAEAERRIREHMRSWQPSTSSDVPTISDAAMPERSTPEPAAPDAMAQTESEEASTESAAQSQSEASTDPVGRLDVVPPEEDQYSEAASVPQDEIDRVQQNLADIESEIVEEGIENRELDQRIEEVRSALEQRDMAGLAVAEESLAELEARLREVREAQAQAEQIADATDESEEAGSDEVADYLSQLEEEFASEEGQQTAMAGDSDSASAQEGMDAESEPATGDDAEEQPTEATDQAAEDDTVESSGESGAAEQGEMTVTRTSSGGWTSWLLPAAGVLVLVLIAAGVFVWLRRRGSDSAATPVGPREDAVSSARSAVARDPADLAARLALLKTLADRGRDEEFTDAFDQMYQEVEDESAPEWQEALALASAHAPDHPLLQPHEAEDAGDEDFDRRADEMLGMLESGPEEEGTETASTDEPFDLDLDTEEFEGADSQEEAGAKKEEGATGDQEDDETEDERFETDMDLAVLSERLDDPSSDRPLDSPSEEEGEEANFEEYEEIDEYATPQPEGEDMESEVEEQAGSGSDSGDLDLDLDFDAARDQESDEVFGEAGAREREELDLDFSSDVDETEEVASDDALDFAPGDAEIGADETASEAGREEPAENEETESGSAQADSEQPEEDASAPDEPEGETTQAGGGALSDEDADVKLDLARAYISVDLADSARSVLEEVVSDGSDEKREEAQKLLDGIE